MAGEDEFAEWIEQLHYAATNSPQQFPGGVLGDTGFVFGRVREAAVRRGITNPGSGFVRVKTRLQLWYEDTEVEDKLADLQSAAAGTDLADYKPPELQTDELLEATLLGYHLVLPELPVGSELDRRAQLIECIVAHENDVLAGLVPSDVD